MLLLLLVVLFILVHCMAFPSVLSASFLLTFFLRFLYPGCCCFLIDVFFLAFPMASSDGAVPDVGYMCHSLSLSSSLCFCSC